jgi:hypothetical protein
MAKQIGHWLGWSAGLLTAVMVGNFLHDHGWNHLAMAFAVGAIAGYQFARRTVVTNG